MRILLLNDGYFLHSLKHDCDCEVFFASPDPDADLQLALEPVSIQHILERTPFNPDVILISDAINLRAAITGLEAVNIPLVFYGVDSPMNYFWQKEFAAACDLTFLDQEEQVTWLRQKFPERAESFHWLPLGADPFIYKKVNVPKEIDIAFVGSLNQQHRPKRSWILQELQKYFKVVVLDGEGKRTISPAEVVQVYNQAKIVLNENLFPGINLRTFEVMASGTCLLNEENNQLTEAFFSNWEHLVTYTPENIIFNTKTLLNDDFLREKIANQGMKQVLEHHTIGHRALTLVDTIRRFINDRHESSCKRTVYLGKAMLEQANRWPQHPVGKLKPESTRLLMSQIEMGCESADLHYELAVEALKEKRHKDAEKSLKRSLEIDPCHIRSSWAGFWVYWEDKQYQSAAKQIGILCHHFRIKTNAQKLIARLSKGKPLNHEDFLALGHMMEKAGWHLETGVDRSLDHPVRWNAFDAYQKAISLNPKSFEPFYYCARLLDKNGSPEFAVLFAEQAYKHKPWDAEITLWLGELLLKCHRREDAVRQLTHYLVNFSDADKWERVEGLSLREDEWQRILTNVLHYCRESVADQRPGESKENMKRRILNYQYDPTLQAPEV